MNLNKLLMFFIISSFIFLFGCSEDDSKSNVNLDEVSSVNEIEFESINNIKELTENIVNKYTIENNLDELDRYFKSIENSFDSKTFNTNFNFEDEDVLNSFKRNYSIIDYKIEDVFYDSLSEKGILNIVYLVNNQRDYSEHFENVVLTDEHDVFVFEYSLEKNKITGFNYYNRK